MSFPRNTLRIALAAALVIGLFALILRFAASDALQAADAQASVRWDSSNGAALTDMAAQSLQKDDQENAVRLAKRALVVEPLFTQALSVLGSAAVKADQKDSADALMSLAGRVKTDAAAHLWLLARKLQAGNYPAALDEIDILFRANPKVANERVMPVFFALLSAQEGQAALASALVKDPPWRSGLLQTLATSAPKPELLLGLSERMRQAKSPLGNEEIRPVLDRLVRDGHIDYAYAEWRASLTPEERAKAGLLYNADFGKPLSGSPFDWTVTPIPGAAISTSPEDHVLRLAFSGSRVPFQNVTHLLALEPGNYELAGLARAASLQNPRGLRWRISCLGDTSAGPLATTPALTGSSPWQPFSVPFTVPAKGCQGQILVLELPARIALEQQISGEAYYKDLAIRSR